MGDTSAADVTQAVVDTSSAADNFSGTFDPSVIGGAANSVADSVNGTTGFDVPIGGTGPLANSAAGTTGFDVPIGTNTPMPGPSVLQGVSDFGDKLWGSVSDPKFLGQSVIGGAVKAGLNAALSGNSPSTARAMPATSSGNGGFGSLDSPMVGAQSSGSLGLNASSAIPSIGNTTGDLSGGLASNNSTPTTTTGSMTNVTGAPIVPKPANANTQGMTSPLNNTSLYGNTFDAAGSNLKPFVDPYSRAVPVT